MDFEHRNVNILFAIFSLMTNEISCVVVLRIYYQTTETLFNSINIFSIKYSEAERHFNFSSFVDILQFTNWDCGHDRLTYPQCGSRYSRYISHNTQIQYTYCDRRTLQVQIQASVVIILVHDFKSCFTVDNSLYWGMKLTPINYLIPIIKKIRIK